MEHFSITKTTQDFHIEGFPNVVKALRFTEHKSQQLADLALHKTDLNFALECLTTINHVPEEPHVCDNRFGDQYLLFISSALAKVNRSSVSTRKRYTKATLGHPNRTATSTASEINIWSTTKIHTCNIYREPY